MNLTVYGPGLTGNKTAEVFYWNNPFGNASRYRTYGHPVGESATFGNEFFTSGAVLQEETWRHATPIISIRCNELFGDSVINTEFNEMVNNFARTPGMSGLGGETGTWSNLDADPGNTAYNIGVRYAYMIEMIHQYYKTIGLTGHYKPAILLHNVFKYPEQHYDYAYPEFRLFNHPQDYLTMNGGTFGMATADIQKIASQTLFPNFGLSAHTQAMKDLFQGIRETLQIRRAEDLTLPDVQYLIYDTEVKWFDIDYPEGESYDGVHSFEFFGPTAEFSGLTYGTEVYIFQFPFGDYVTKACFRKLKENENRIDLYRKFNFSSGNWIADASHTNLSSLTFIPYDYIVSVTSDYESAQLTGLTIFARIGTNNYTRDYPALTDTVLLNPGTQKGPGYFVRLPADATGPSLRGAVPGTTADFGPWHQNINDSRASSYLLFDKYTLLDLWGRTGPYVHSGTSGVNYSPNFFRPGYTITGPTSSSDSLIVQPSNIHYRFNVDESIFDSNADWYNFILSFNYARYQYYIGKSFESVKAENPQLKILGDYSVSFYNKQNPGFNDKIYRKLYPAEIVAGITGPNNAPASATGVYKLDAVGPHLGYSKMEGSLLNARHKSVYTNRGFTAGISLSGSFNTDTNFRYATFLNWCASLGLTTIKGGFGLTGTANGTGQANVNNLRDISNLRYYHNIKELEHIRNSIDHFDEIRGLPIAIWLTESEDLVPFTIGNSAFGTSADIIGPRGNNFDYHNFIRKAVLDYDTKYIILYTAKGFMTRDKPGLTGVTGAIKTLKDPGNVLNKLYTTVYTPDFNIPLTAYPSGITFPLQETVIPAYYDTPSPQFTQSATSGTGSLTVIFTQTSTGPTATGYQWDFTNNGSFDFSGATADYTYTVGTYSVRLRALNEYGFSDIIKNNLIEIKEEIQNRLEGNTQTTLTGVVRNGRVVFEATRRLPQIIKNTNLNSLFEE